MDSKTPIRVLFVCLGNICRSPMAEGMFLHHLEKAGLRHQFVVDSAGTSGHHAGERPDKRMLATAQQHGVHLPSRARQVRPSDFWEFDHIVGMDHRNVEDLQAIRPPQGERLAQLHLMRAYDVQGKGLGVPDPYYGGQEGFEEVYQILDRSTKKFLKAILDPQAP